MGLVGFRDWDLEGMDEFLVVRMGGSEIGRASLGRLLLTCCIAMVIPQDNNWNWQPERAPGDEHCLRYGIFERNKDLC